MERWLLAGLGNPGSEYAATRHNVGFCVADELARRWRIELARKQFDALLGLGEIAGEPVILMKPQSFMNLSGQSVVPAASFYGVLPEKLVVFHDDIDLPFGRLRVKEGGGHGGHRGLRSLTEGLGHGDFLRVRVGVGRPALGDDVIDHVLGHFATAEEAQLTEVIGRAADAVEEVLRHGVRSAMNRFNAPPAAPLTGPDPADPTQQGAGR